VFISSGETSTRRQLITLEDYSTAHEAKGGYNINDEKPIAVCDAYGWPLDTLDSEESMLSRLLALNLARTNAQNLNNP
jgi:hypothetical protein